LRIEACKKPNPKLLLEHVKYWAARKGRSSILIVLVYCFIIDQSKGMGYWGKKEEVEDHIVAI
jgi:hypothetical protein